MIFISYDFFGKLVRLVLFREYVVPYNNSMSTMKHKVAIFILLACASMFAQDWPTNGWSPAPPADMGMDENKLIQARDYAMTLGGGSGIITRYGKLVLSWGNLSTLYDMKSTTKAFGTIALGLAIKDGLLQLDDFAQQHHPSIGIPPQSNAGTGWLDDITILHLATHTAGFDKDGGYVQLLFQPGTAWKYGDGGANWLAETITLAFLEDLNTVMFNRVFSNLGISANDLIWRDNVYRSDSINGMKNREFGSGIETSVDAMARIGYLFLREGMWEGQQIIPNSFIQSATSTIPSIAGLPSLTQQFPNGPDHYGLLIWNNQDGTMSGIPQDVFMSWGLKESFIIVIPGMDIVVSRAGGPWRQDALQKVFIHT